MMEKVGFVSLLLIGVVSSCGPQSMSQLQVVNAEANLSNAPSQWVTRSTLQIENTAEGSLCTAVIVSKNRILTARHCVTTDAGSDYTLRFGKDVEAASVVTLKGTGTVRRHTKEDLATVNLASPLPSGFEPVPIHTEDVHLTPGKTAVVAGYGALSEDSDGNVTGDFRYLRWGWIRFDEWLEEITSAEGMVLRSVLGWLPCPRHTMFCRGDSGGSVYAEFDGKWGLVGINSLCELGCEGGGYTADPRYNRAWINQE